ncbi:MAG TPA: SIS domain-containing protein [Candidatus Acidoferrum sp.]|nr:SIS domain-containing protein [Candidatus Acidoferrum sp.]
MNHRMNHDQKLERLRLLGDETAVLRRAVVEKHSQQLIDLANLTAGVIGSGGKVLIAGNGGHASMSSHFAAEMVVRLSAEHNRQALPALALSVDPAVMTATANDYGFEALFARQIEALGKKGDMLIVMSTSGNSMNLVRAVQVAHEKEMLTFGFLGGTGGKLARQVERSIIIPHLSPQRIQEEHLFLVHQLVELVESDLVT